MGLSWPERLHVEPSAATARQARAYCGPAHHHSWRLPPGEEPADVVELSTPVGPTSYHLVRHPWAGHPSRDHYGNFLYIPVPEARTV